MSAWLPSHRISEIRASVLEPRVTFRLRPLVVWLRIGLCTEGGEAPGWQGATREYAGRM